VLPRHSERIRILHVHASLLTYTPTRARTHTHTRARAHMHTCIARTERITFRPKGKAKKGPVDFGFVLCTTHRPLLGLALERHHAALVY
jgi:hypothetical protein